MAVRLQGRVPAQEPGAAVRYLARHGGQTIRAPVPRSSNPGLGGEGPGDSPDLTSGTRGQGCGEVVLRDPAGQGGQGRPSARRPSEAAEQGVLAPYRLRSWPSGASPDALLLLPSPERTLAAGLSVSVRWRVVMTVGRRGWRGMGDKRQSIR